MKDYAVDIAPGYAPVCSGSLTDGKHGCTVQAETMEGAIEAVRDRAAREQWPAGEAMITEINKFGRRVEGFMGTGPQRISFGDKQNG